MGTLCVGHTVLVITLLAPGTSAVIDVLSREDHDFTPDVIWLFPNVTEPNSTSQARAVLHDVTLTSGPVYPSGASPGAVTFKGTPSSFLHIPNTGGTFNASDFFAWTLVVRPANLTRTAVLLEYWDGTGGLRVWQNHTSVTVHAEDRTGLTHTLQASGLFHDPSSWVTLVVTFVSVKVGKKDPELKLYHAPYDMSRFTYRTSPVPAGTELRGDGDVRVGASVMSNLTAFQGDVTCLAFHSAYVGGLPEAVEYGLTCDPQGLLSEAMPAIAGQFWKDDSGSTTLSMTMTTESPGTTPPTETTPPASSEGPEGPTPTPPPETTPPASSEGPEGPTPTPPPETTPPASSEGPEGPTPTPPPETTPPASSEGPEGPTPTPPPETTPRTVTPSAPGVLCDGCCIHLTRQSTGVKLSADDIIAETETERPWPWTSIPSICSCSL
ncbi:uncharacterized protein LOC143294364 isoform X2 [Babylonia areolata]|uniref:uncharacterized protein LOC143294364 isoform X2 n=1 Tax=Babylonia areolata TaxID=304850 RepID=UPI003FD37C26